LPLFTLSFRSGLFFVPSLTCTPPRKFSPQVPRLFTSILLYNQLPQPPLFGPRFRIPTTFRVECKVCQVFGLPNCLARVWAATPCLLLSGFRPLSHSPFICLNLCRKTRLTSLHHGHQCVAHPIPSATSFFNYSQVLSLVRTCTTIGCPPLLSSSLCRDSTLTDSAVASFAPV